MHNEVRIEFLGGPLDGRFATGDYPPEEFSAPYPLGLGEGAESARYRRVEERTPTHVIVAYVGECIDSE